MAEYVELHGDGVKDVALRTTDAAASFYEAVRRGARPVCEPRVYEGPQGRLMRATVASPVGDVVHSFIQRQAPEVDFWPGRFQAVAAPVPQSELMVAVDHVALCLMEGTLQETVEAYARTLGFHESHEENVETRYGGMNSKVVQDASGRRYLFTNSLRLKSVREGSQALFEASRTKASIFFPSVFTRIAQ